MERRGFILSVLAFFSASIMAGAKSLLALSSGNGFKVKAGEARFGKHFRMKGITMNTLDIKISGQDTSDALAVFEQTGHTPNGGPPLHIHTGQDEWFYILEGEYIFQLGGERFMMKKGDTIFLPRNIPHGFVQLSEEARVIVSFLPAGKIEDFFRITDTWTTPPSQEEIRKVMEDHDMIVAGPPIRV